MSIESLIFVGEFRNFDTTFSNVKLIILLFQFKKRSSGIYFRMLYSFLQNIDQ